jgi:hypothetical protein
MSSCSKDHSAIASAFAALIVPRECQLPVVIAGVKFTDGAVIAATPDQHSA